MMHWLPHFVNIDLFKDYDLAKDINWLMMGKLAFYYPLRVSMYKKMRNMAGFVNHPHPGYRNINDDQEQKVLVGEAYALKIGRRGSTLFLVSPIDLMHFFQPFQYCQDLIILITQMLHYDFNLLFSLLVDLKVMFSYQAVLLILPVLAHHYYRPGVSSLKGQYQVEKDERVRIPGTYLKPMHLRLMDCQDYIKDHPDSQKNTLEDYKPPTSYSTGHFISCSLTESSLFSKDFVDVLDRRVIVFVFGSRTTFNFHQMNHSFPLEKFALSSDYSANLLCWPVHNLPRVKIPIFTGDILHDIWTGFAKVGYPPPIESDMENLQSEIF
jgi:hypothetical protein